MKSFAIKTMAALVVLVANYAVVSHLWDALSGWGVAIACVALLAAVGSAAWAVAKALGRGRGDSIVEYRSELSTLAFPPSSFRK